MSVTVIYAVAHYGVVTATSVTIKTGSILLMIILIVIQAFIWHTVSISDVCVIHNTLHQVGDNYTKS